MNLNYILIFSKATQFKFSLQALPILHPEPWGVHCAFRWWWGPESSCWGWRQSPGEGTQSLLWPPSKQTSYLIKWSVYVYENWHKEVMTQVHLAVKKAKYFCSSDSGAITAVHYPLTMKYIRVIIYFIILWNFISWWPFLSSVLYCMAEYQTPMLANPFTGTQKGSQNTNSNIYAWSFYKSLF